MLIGISNEQRFTAAVGKNVTQLMGGYHLPQDCKTKSHANIQYCDERKGLIAYASECKHAGELVSFVYDPKK
jgi:hypothetical protein